MAACVICNFSASVLRKIAAMSSAHPTIVILSGTSYRMFDMIGIGPRIELLGTPQVIWTSFVSLLGLSSVSPTGSLVCN